MKQVALSAIGLLAAVAEIMSPADAKASIGNIAFSQIGTRESPCCLVPIATGDVPETGHHRGGGRHHGKGAAPVSAGTPELKKTETPEAAQKQYQKKYGF